MPIELHCPKCGKLIRAPENAGGKHGKCPNCAASVYVPMPPTDDDIIPIAPLDEDEERRAEEERRNALRYAATLEKATDIPGEKPTRGREGGSGGGPRRPAETPGEVINLAEEVERFIVAMRDSKLDVAESAAARLNKSGARARDYVEGLMLDEIPPQIGNMPPALVQGLLKTLLGRLG